MSLRLELQDLAFSYGERRVLAGLNLIVEPGEMVALLGPNGCGKTTLLRLASGVLQPDSGKVCLGGEDILRMNRREVARRISVLPQELEAPPGWRVREAVSLGRTPHIGLLGSESLADLAAIDRALRVTATQEIADQDLHTLSGGQRQRVAVALAVTQEPRLLLLDEPTAHLDLRYRVTLLDSITELKENLGLTVLAAMHDPNLAALYFPRLLLLSSGRIVADGSPQEVLTVPLLEQVYGVPVRVRFDSELGAPVVTVLPARLQAHGLRAR